MRPARTILIMQLSNSRITGILTRERLTCDEELIGVLEDRRYEILMSSADAF